MKKVVTFGEIMVRLNPEGYLRLPQADRFLVGYTGAEANVSVALSYQGIRSEFVTKVPDNAVSDCAEMTMHKYGVETRHWARGGERLGLYYLEKGASQRASKVIYDRKHTAISEANVGDFDWKVILAGASVLHITGITPALGKDLPDICLEAMKEAKRKGVVTSLDLNYRSKLWSPEQAQSAMRKIACFADVIIGNEEDAAISLGIGSAENAGSTPEIEKYKITAENIVKEFGCKTVAFSLRTSHSASDNDWQGFLFNNGEVYLSRKYKMHIIDRVGGGDSFAAGIIYSVMNDFDYQHTIEYATAASCLKHSIEFDFNLSSVEEINALVKGNGSGRVVR